MRFAIIGGGRTGSSHLVKLLNRHPEIVCHGELFHGKGVQLRLGHLAQEERAALRTELEGMRKRDPLAYLERIYGVSGGAPIVGFKIFSTHNPAVLKHIVGDGAIRKVVLYRANALARHASLLAAIETGDWHGADKPTVRFEAQDFLQTQGEFNAFIDETIRALVAARQPFQVVRYDELNNATMIASLMRFLGATTTPPLVERRPQDLRASPDIVSRFANPRDVKRFLRKHGLMHWAHEGDMLFDALPAPPEDGHFEPSDD